jgi:16S rRNA (cytosine1402-N4)-methyltransferase
MTSEPHTSVLLAEAVKGLAIKKGKWYIDTTFGRGGYTREILKQGGLVVAIDQDEDAITYGKAHFVLEVENRHLRLFQDNFEHLGEIVRGLPIEVKGNLAGVIADLGTSNPQLDEADRGFSFQQDAPLDMRMDKRLGVTARDLVNALGKKELYDLFTTYAQEQHARLIVARILEYRKRKPIETTRELAEIIEKVVRRQGHLHPATKAFLALRIAVNDELGALERMLPQGLEALEPNGRLAIVSFHEGEDRIVKHFMKSEIAKGTARAITDKPIEPTSEEQERNQRSRSGKLRIIEKV